MVKHKREGFEFLESETEIYNLLIKEQNNDNPILGLYTIDLINDSYMTRDSLEANTIYVVRDETSSDKIPTTFTGEGYNVKVQIILTCSNYDTIRASALLKTTVKTIRQVLAYESIDSYAHIDQIIPEYVEPGRLTEYRLELNCYEIDTLGRYNYDDLKVYLEVHADIQGEYPYTQIFPCCKKKNKPLPTWKNEIDEEEFGGG